MSTTTETTSMTESFPPLEEAGTDYIGRKRPLLKLVIQIIHLAVAATILIIGFAEFSVEPTVFDLFGKEGVSVPDKVFKVTTCLTILCDIIYACRIPVSTLGLRIRLVVWCVCSVCVMSWVIVLFCDCRVLNIF